MLKFLLKNRFIYLFGLTTFNLFSVPINNLKAEYININNTTHFGSQKVNQSFAKNNSEEFNFENEFKNFDNHLLKLLSENKENKENKEKIKK